LTGAMVLQSQVRQGLTLVEEGLKQRPLQTAGTSPGGKTRMAIQAKIALNTCTSAILFDMARVAFGTSFLQPICNQSLFNAHSIVSGNGFQQPVCLL
jgi:hypothetical protein